MLDEYAEKLKFVGPVKKFPTKKIMWVHIADDLKKKAGLTKTADQCENRYKTVMKRKKSSEKNNSTSGAKRMAISFENEIGKIAAIDDSLEPEILQSSNKIVSNMKETSVSKGKPKSKLSKYITNNTCTKGGCETKKARGETPAAEVFSRKTKQLKMYEIY